MADAPRRRIAIVVHVVFPGDPRMPDGQFPNNVFFAGQLAFARETRLTRLLHNYTAFALQRRFFAAELPLVVLPVRV